MPSFISGKAINIFDYQGPWERTKGPWQRIHADFAGPVGGEMLLIIVDSFSKWIEAIPMKSTSSARTITEFSRLFARYGLPVQLCTDNGPQFISEEMAAYLKHQGIRHIRVAPYHPASNGLAERGVRTVKYGLKALAKGGGMLENKLVKIQISTAGYDGEESGRVDVGPHITYTAGYTSSGWRR